MYHGREPTLHRVSPVPLRGKGRAPHAGALFHVGMYDGSAANPERCLNLHFFHPMLVLQLVEVMRGPQTSREAVDTTVELAKRIGKEPVVINREIYAPRTQDRKRVL